MVNYGGNSFPRQTAETHAERLPLWNYIDHSRLIGVAMLPDDTYPPGTRFPAGSPVQLGDQILIGEAATTPNGLLRADVIMGEGGCTLTIVRSGSIRASLMEEEVTGEQKAALPLIEFDYEPKFIKQSVPGLGL